MLVLSLCLSGPAEACGGFFDVDCNLRHGGVEKGLRQAGTDIKNGFRAVGKAIHVQRGGGPSNGRGMHGEDGTGVGQIKEDKDTSKVLEAIVKQINPLDTKALIESEQQRVAGPKWERAPNPLPAVAPPDYNYKDTCHGLECEGPAETNPAMDLPEKLPEPFD